MFSPDRFFEALNGRQRLFAFCMLVVGATLLVAFVATDTPRALMITAALLVLIWITRPVWTPDGQGRTRVAIVSLGVVMSTATLFVGGREWLEPILLQAARSLLGPWYDGSLQGAVEGSGNLTAMVLGFVFVTVFSINHLLRDRPPMQVHPVPLDRDFPEKEYRQRLRHFCDILEYHLRQLNTETNWSEAYFTPLQAQVEVTSGNRSTRRITDLLNAIKSNQKSHVFLVLGDPGSGKSVALRTLAMELLADVERSGRVPIYINLREWRGSQAWSEDNPPTVEALYDFILESLKARSDMFGREFLDLYFRKMLDYGRFFLLLDSFDEIPAVLDVSEASWMIERISTVIATLFAPADASRGVVASRVFRRPKFALAQNAVLEVRPFSELQIAEALTRSPAFNEQTLRELFANRPELVPIARNPFTAALIRTFASEHHGLPTNQVQLYDSYLRGRLAASDEKLRKLGLTSAEVIAGCRAIAWTMFTSEDYRLEAPVPRLESDLPAVRVREIAKVLQYARLGRMGEAETETFSFVHRRFAEYFVALELIQNAATVRVQDIIFDSRWRDALVLYCEVAPAEEAERIAVQCWDEIHQADTLPLDSPDFLRAVHALRFLTDAFRGRPECIRSIQDSLAAYIEARTNPGQNLLMAKLAVEAVGLLREDHIEEVILSAFSQRNPWIDDTALRACRHLPQIGSELEDAIRDNLSGFTVPQFLRRRRELMFSLSLSDGFRRLQRYCVMRTIDHHVLIVSLLLSLLLFPALFLVMAGGLLFSYVWEATTVDSRSSIPSFFSDEVFQEARSFAVFGGFVGLVYLCWIHGMETVIQGVVQYSPVRRYAMAVPYQAWIAVMVVALLAWIPSYKINTRKLPSLRAADVVAGVTVSIFMLLVAGALWKVDKMVAEPLKGTVWLLPFAIGVLVGLVRAFSGARRLWEDWRSYRRIRSHPVVERRAIERNLNALRTSRFRLKYVHALADAGRKPMDTWSPGTNPFRRNDPAATLLAQLEEKWLGLDR